MDEKIKATSYEGRKICFNCEQMMWMVGLGLGLRCRLSSPPKIIEHREHTCDKFEVKIKTPSLN